MIARILAKLSLNITEWDANLRRAAQGADTFARANMMQVKNSIAGAFTVGAIVYFTNKLANAAEQTLNVSRSLGVSVTAFQALSAAAKQSGSSQDDMIKMLQKLRASMGAAASGSESMQENFTNLGVSIDGIEKQDPVAVLEKIAKASRGAAEDSKTFSDIIQVLGRDALPKMGAVLEELANESLTELEKKYALVINSQEELQNLATAKGNIEYAGQVVGSIGTGILGGTIGVARHIAGLFSEKEEVPYGPIWFEEEQRKKRRTSAEGYEEMVRGGRRWNAERGNRIVNSEDNRRSIEAPFEEDYQAMRRDRSERGRRGQEAIQEMQYAREAEEEKKRDQQRKDALDRARILRGEGIGGGAPRGDELARIGGFVGGRTDPMRAAAERQIRILEDLRSLGREIAARNAKDVSDN